MITSLVFILLVIVGIGGRSGFKYDIEVSEEGFVICVWSLVVHVVSDCTPVKRNIIVKSPREIKSGVSINADEDADNKPRPVHDRMNAKDERW